MKIRHRALVACLGLGVVLSWSACNGPTNDGPSNKGPSNKGPTNNMPSNNGAVTEKLTIEKARHLSDAVADDLINRRSGALREKGERAFRNQVDDAAFVGMLDQMYQAYGTPLEFEFKKVEQGNKAYPDGENKEMFKFWYAARTSKAEKGRYFLFVEVVQDDKNVAFSSFAIVQFQGEAPENLR